MKKEDEKKGENVKERKRKKNEKGKIEAKRAIKNLIKGEKGARGINIGMFRSGGGEIWFFGHTYILLNRVRNSAYCITEKQLFGSL
jgi:hypothetical protein